MSSFRRHFRRTLAIAAIVGCSTIISWQPTELRSNQNSVKPPSHILIIRHAEKPPDTAKSVDLSAEGKQRAEALYKLFAAGDKRPNPLPKPDFIFATKNTKHSFRPLETVVPLAKKLNLPINANYTEEDSAKLADDIMRNPQFSGKTILISWHHGMIPKIAEKLKAPGAPDHWKGSVFDRVWEIDFDAQSKETFQDLPQQLLPNDSQK